MKKEYPYRIKTKEEFIKDYGENWRYNNSEYNFTVYMDYILGEDYPYFIVPGSQYLPRYMGCRISWSFLVIKSPKPTYKSRKIEKTL